MRRAAIVIAVLGTMLVAGAVERPPLAVGATYNYASEYGNHGMGFKLQVRAGEHLRFEPEMIYSNMRHDVTTLHLNMNVHYVVPVTGNMNLYPFVGVSYSHWGYEGPNVNRWGANLGAGIEQSLGHNWWVLGELRLQLVKQESQVITGLGLKYEF